MAERHQDKAGRKDHTNQTDRGESLLGRRSYIKMAGATVGAVMGSGVAAGQSSEYDEITVSANSTEQIELGDGETLENTLIDQSAEGAKAYIKAFGSDWAIRNVGVKGRITGRDGEVSDLIFAEVSEGSTGVIENVYLGDGAAAGSRFTGVLVEDSHAGTLKIRNVNVGHWTDNGFYCSPPGEDDSNGMGETHIENCYGHNNNITSFRIGTPGSYVENSVADHTGDIPAIPGGAVNGRGIWGKERPGLEARNCDIVHPDGTAVVGSDRGEITLEDTCLEGGVNGNVVGSSAGSPEPSPPEGVPMTPAEAASGNLNGGESGGSNDDSSDEDDSGEAAKALSVETEAGGPLLEYEFTVDGPVEKAEAAEGNDTISQSEDGTTTVTGVTGNGYTDAYRFEGALLDWSTADRANYTIRFEDSAPGQN